MSSLGYYSKFYSTFTSLQRHKNLKTGSALLGFNLLTLFNNPDTIDKNVKTVNEADRHGVKAETGMDRLKLMFTQDQFGDMSPELINVMEGGLMGFFLGSVMGGSYFSKEAYQNFLEKNQATVFHSNLDAQKRLSDKVYTGFFRGAWMWGWRLGFFTGSITLFTTAVSVYRNKSSVIEYTCGGAISGILYKFKNGPKAMVSGGVVGGVLGTVAGSISLLIMYLTGTTMEDLRYWQYQWKEKYQEDKLKKFNEARERDMDLLLKSRKALITTDKENDLDPLLESAPSDMLQSLEANNQNETTNVVSKHVDETTNLASKLQIEQTTELSCPN